MSTLFPKKIDILRRVVTLVEGEPVYTETPGFFLGSVQPLANKPDKDMKDLPTGRMDMGRVRVYASERLNVGKEGVSGTGDVILWVGNRYELTKEISYQMGVIPSFKYLAELLPGVTP